MTMHDYIANWNYGEIKKIPSNTTMHDMKYYARMNLQYSIKQVGPNELIRFCSYCKHQYS